MKALVGAFNQEKALVGAFSVIIQLHRLIVYTALVPGLSSEVGVAGVCTGSGDPPHPGLAPQLVLVARHHILRLGVDRLEPGPGAPRVEGVEAQLGAPALSSRARGGEQEVAGYGLFYHRCGGCFCW